MDSRTSDISIKATGTVRDTVVTETSTHLGGPSNPSDVIADDPDDIQAKLGQKAQ